MGKFVRASAAACLFALAITSHTSRAYGDGPTDHAVAESLFDEGRKLLDEGKLEQACAKLEASERMDAAVGTLLNLGECNERRGRIASAWSNYREAASLAMARGDSKRAEFARKRSEAVQPRRSTLAVVVPSPEPALRVKRDGVPVDAQAWGLALPVDPGPHVIEAEAPGKKPWSSTIVIAEGAPQAASVTIPPLATDSTRPATAVPLSRGAAPTPSNERGSNTVRTVGFLGLGAGAVATGVGVYFALRAQSVWSDGKPHCDESNRCDEVGFALNRDARRFGDMATFTLTAGVVVAAAGALLVLLAPKTFAPASPSSPTRRISLNYDGMRLLVDLP